MSVSSYCPLAFGFASPWLLAGLILCGIPIVIHWLFKRQYGETDWAAMRFLVAAARKHSKRIRLQQLLLLVLRALLVALVILAMARPYVETFGTFFEEVLPMHRVIVVDASFSMRHRTAGIQDFERAREAARQIVSDSRQGDATNLVRIAGSNPRTIIRQPAFERDRVVNEINQLEVTAERGDVLATLQAVTPLLDAAPQLTRKEIALISDFQMENWLPSSGSTRQRICRLLKTLADRASITLIDVGQPKATNSAVTGIRVVERVATVERPLHVRATLRHFADTARSGCPVELYVDGQLAETRTVELLPNVDVTETFTTTMHDVGDRMIEVRMEEDSLSIDDQRRLCVPTRDVLDILLVDGRRTRNEQDSATYYVCNALAPSTPDRPWHGIMRPTVVPEGQIPTGELNRFDCVFLCDVALLTQREADVLQTYVRAGGGLVVCMGSRVQWDRLNERLFRDGQGILPAKLIEVVGTPLARTDEDIHTLDLNRSHHPLLDAFEGIPDSGLERIMTFQYIRAQFQPDARLRGVLYFDSGDPALITHQFGNGFATLITTSVDNTWGTWSVSTCFVPLINELVQLSLSGRVRSRQSLVGQTLNWPALNANTETSVTIRRPDEETKAIHSGDRDGVPVFQYAATDVTGFYQMTTSTAPAQSASFAVNVDPRESDLHRLTDERIKADLLPGVDYRYCRDVQTIGRPTTQPETERGGLTRWLLLAAVCLLLVEQLMAWRFGYGFFALCSLVLITFAVELWNVHPFVSVVAATVLVVAAGILGLKLWGRAR